MTAHFHVDQLKEEEGLSVVEWMKKNIKHS
jgi:hypothetical protein